MNERPLEGRLLDWRRTISAQTAVGWLLAEGLVASLLQLGWVPGGDEVRAPGLTELLGELSFLASASTTALEDAVDAAWAVQVEHGSDLAGLLAEAEAVLGSPSDGEVEARLIIVAGVAVRRAAQAVLGATSHMGASTEVIRLERAAVELLGFGGSGRGPVPLHRDGLRLYSLDPGGLRSEIAGISARLLCDWGGSVVFGAPDGRSLELRVTGDRLVATPSWAADGPIIWDSPIRLADLGSEVGRLLEGELGVTSARELTVVTSP